MDFDYLFDTFQERTLHGRHITLNHIEGFIKRLSGAATVATLGESVQKRPLYVCTLGRGKTSVLIWSQMHGNESTTTKAVLDVLNFLKSRNELSKTMLDRLTLHIVPMLNPDGAETYSRENARGFDLNRDFCDLTQPESMALWEYFKKTAPDFCFNLHDQRTIYGAGDSGKPATVSFLSPSFNESREISDTRQKAMEVIVSMNRALQRYIPGQVGRFDDSFNINCVGDTFQVNQVPTILFEAGHFPGDYSREETRKCIFTAILAGLEHIHENVIVNNGIQEYLNIPQNKINFYDIVYKNVKINCDGIEKITNFAAQFSEVLMGDEIIFEARIAESQIPDTIFGHKVIDAHGALFRDGGKNRPELDHKADFYLGNRKFVNGTEA